MRSQGAQPILGQRDILTPMNRIALLLIVSAGLTYACECSSPPLQEAQYRADLIFRGKIVRFRATATGPLAVFAVERIWKGDIAGTFEMPAIKETTGCTGFWPDWLKVGNDLIVFARKITYTGAYVTDICSRTTFASRSRDLMELEPGRPPKSK